MSAYVQKKAKRERERRKGEQHTRGHTEQAKQEKGKTRVEGGRREGNKNRRGNPEEQKQNTRRRMQAMHARWPHPPMARQALAKSRTVGKPWHQFKSCSRVQFLQPLGKHLPHLPGVLGLEEECHITPVPHLLRQPVAVLGEVHLGPAVNEGRPAVCAWKLQARR